MMDEIIFLEPKCTHNIWGGERIKKEFGCQVEGNDIGECWGISAHPNGDGIVFDKSIKERKERENCKNSENAKECAISLSQLWTKKKELFTEEELEQFPLLVKIIDAKDDLSIQVHPDDAYAKRNENGSLGKMECWYILDCKEDAKLVVGHNARNKEELIDMIDHKRWQEFIREIPVKRGDFVQINPGTVHAIKGGILLLETQQNSDITYRVYDYDRLQNGKPRELHVEKSKEVIAIGSEASVEAVNYETVKKNKMNQLTTCKYYSVYKTVVEEEYELVRRDISDNCILCSVIDGNGSVNGHPIKKGEHFIVTRKCGQIRFEGEMELILSTF